MSLISAQRPGSYNPLAYSGFAAFLVLSPSSSMFLTSLSAYDEYALTLRFSMPRRQIHTLAASRASRSFNWRQRCVRHLGSDTFRTCVLPAGNKKCTYCARQRHKFLSWIQTLFSSMSLISAQRLGRKPYLAPSICSPQSSSMPGEMVDMSAASIQDDTALMEKYWTESLKPATMSFGPCGKTSTEFALRGQFWWLRRLVQTVVSRMPATIEWRSPNAVFSWTTVLEWLCNSKMGVPKSTAKQSTP